MSSNNLFAAGLVKANFTKTCTVHNVDSQMTLLHVRSRVAFSIAINLF